MQRIGNNCSTDDQFIDQSRRAITVITATELAIHWNKITGVRSISSAGQTIPMILGIGTILRVFYVASTHKEVDEEIDGVYKPADFDAIPGAQSNSWTSDHPLQSYPAYSVPG